MSDPVVDYGPDVESAITALSTAIGGVPGLDIRHDTRWLAIAILDGDPGIDDLVRSAGGERLLCLRSDLLDRIEDETGQDISTIIAGRRYDVAHVVTRSSTHGDGAHGPTGTDRIDSVVTNRYVGIPIFFAAMWLVFKLTTDVAGALIDWVDVAVSGPITELATALVAAVGLGDTWFDSLLVDGAIAGVGAIVVFVPVLVCLYLALAFLEDTGYMARAAFVMDRLMRGVGLQGKSFLPMLVGFGCTVPAVYATRTLDNERDRILTAMLVPFMSCGARLPVYVLMSSVFFAAYASVAVFSMYVLGIGVALVIGLVLQRTALPAEIHAPTIMELPPYHMPTWRTIWFHTWVRTKAFLREASSLIFFTMMVVWLLMAVPVSGSGSFADTDVDQSAFAAVSSAVAPVFEPAGFGSWEATGSLLSGFVAKEVIIGTMAQSYDAGQPDEPSSPTSAVESAHLKASIESGFEESSGGLGGLAAVAFMVFVLLYTPCMAAVGAIRHEIGTSWMWASIVGQTLLAWVTAVGVFQIGKVVGLG